MDITMGMDLPFFPLAAMAVQTEASAALQIRRAAFTDGRDVEFGLAWHQSTRVRCNAFQRSARDLEAHA